MLHQQLASVTGAIKEGKGETQKEIVKECCCIKNLG